MKKLFLGLILISFLSACNHSESAKDEAIVLNDTISTPSGLQYIYLKQGRGPQIDTGSKVKAFTNLYLNDVDTVYWTTASEADSSFVFIHARTSLIKGFSELNSYLREGDEVIAILPDSLAYGKEGRGGVPPGATLIYKPYVVRSVSKAKESLVDTLAALNKVDPQGAMEFYREVLNTSLKEQYHAEVEDLMDLLTSFQRDSAYGDIMSWSDYLATFTQKQADLEYLDYYRVAALNEQAKYKEALLLAEPWTQKGANQSFWKDVVQEIQDSINSNLL